MGVHGLWRLLDSFGTVVQPDDLRGKRVAIDASIWMAQFRARAAAGDDLEHYILEGFLARILKLLFYGIKPVFVFDGTASSAKSAEHYRRARQRTLNAAALLKRRAKQIVMAQVAAGTLNLEELRAAVQATSKKNEEEETVEDSGEEMKTAAQAHSSDAMLDHSEEVSKQLYAHLVNTADGGAYPVAQTMDGGVQAVPMSQEGTAQAKPPLAGKRRRRRDAARQTRCRRRRLAPDAVSARTTMRFLQDVEGLLEDRQRQEARILHNALHYTSTSLFMGPRRAVEEEEEDGAHRDSVNANGEHHARLSAQPVVDVDDNDGPSHEVTNCDVLSIEDSDAAYTENEEEEEDEEDTSSGSCTVSSLDETASVITEDHEEEVTVMDPKTRPADSVGGDERRAALQQPVLHMVDPASRSPSMAPGTAVLLSNDLARFLSNLTHSTSPALTPPVPEETEKTAKASPLKKAETSLKKAAAGEPLESPADGSLAKSAETIHSSNSDTGDSASGEESSSQAAESGSVEWEEEEEADSDKEDESDGGSDDFKAVISSATWEPFTQRLNPALLLQQRKLPSSAAEEKKRTAKHHHAHLTNERATTPPQTHRGAAESHQQKDSDDDDFTPVKVSRRLRALSDGAVVVVHSSGDEEESAPLLQVTAPHTSAALRSEKDDGDTAHTHPLSSATHNSTDAAVQHPASEAAFLNHHISPSVVPHHATTKRTSAAIIPFDLLHVVELLDCCGVPYVLSPAEADAQCAFLARHDLVDAVFTEDSDVLVHGATTVLRGFFSQSKHVVAYKQAELAACGITKTVLVALAQLLGCDYTDGVLGIGLVGALEALAVSWTPAENIPDMQDSPYAVVHVLKRWYHLVQAPPRTWHDVDQEMSITQYAVLQSLLPQWATLERVSGFPSTYAVESFFLAEVDPDTTPFTWLPPDWSQIRIFAGALGALSSTWMVQRYELARKECLRREEEEAKRAAAGLASGNGQRLLTEFGAQERVRATWAFQKQPKRHASVLSQLRAAQHMT